MKKNAQEHLEARIELLEIEKQDMEDALSKALRENECLWNLLIAIKRWDVE